MPLWIGAILIGQCILLSVVGWYVYQAQRSPAAGDQRPMDHGGKVARVHALFDNAGAALADHAELLDAFQHALGGGEPNSGEHSNDALHEQCDEMRCANRRVDQSVDETLCGLSEAGGDVFDSKCARLAGYQRQTSRFDAMLGEIDRESMLAGLAGRLLDMVHELRDENKSIRKELVEAKDTTIDLLNRAHFAERTARVDPLTQLPNRRAFDEFHAQCEAALARKGELFCLVILDIDHFKGVNDKFGHAAGDAVLSMIGRVLKNNRRTGDHVSRLGGEEFAMLLPGCEQESGRMVAERYRQKIESASLRYRDHELSVTVSCGVAEAAIGQSRRRLLERADSALYAAKTSGRNCTYVDPWPVDDRSQEVDDSACREATADAPAG